MQEYRTSKTHQNQIENRKSSLNIISVQLIGYICMTITCMKALSESFGFLIPTVNIIQLSFYVCFQTDVCCSHSATHMRYVIRTLWLSFHICCGVLGFAVVYFFLIQCITLILHFTQSQATNHYKEKAVIWSHLWQR